MKQHAPPAATAERLHTTGAWLFARCHHSGWQRERANKFDNRIAVSLQIGSGRVPGEAAKRAAQESATVQSKSCSVSVGVACAITHGSAN